MIIRVVNMSNASDETLRSRVDYGGRKGRRAARRLRRQTRIHYYDPASLRITFGGVEIHGVTSVELHERTDRREPFRFSTGTFECKIESETPCEPSSS